MMAITKEHLHLAYMAELRQEHEDLEGLVDLLDQAVKQGETESIARLIHEIRGQINYIKTLDLASRDTQEINQ